MGYQIQKKKHVKKTKKQRSNETRNDVVVVLDVSFLDRQA